MTARTTRLVVLAALATCGCSSAAQRRVEAPLAGSRGTRCVEADADLPEHLRGTILEQVTVFGTHAAGHQRLRRRRQPRQHRPRRRHPDARPRTASRKPPQRRDVGSPSDRAAGSASSRRRALLADPRTTVVRVEGYVPPAAQPWASAIDVAVRALETNTTPSLAGGFLWLTELHKRRRRPTAARRAGEPGRRRPRAARAQPDLRAAGARGRCRDAGRPHLAPQRRDPRRRARSSSSGRSCYASGGRATSTARQIEQRINYALRPRRGQGKGRGASSRCACPTDRRLRRPRAG